MGSGGSEVKYSPKLIQPPESPPNWAWWLCTVQFRLFHVASAFAFRLFRVCVAERVAFFSRRLFSCCCFRVANFFGLFAPLSLYRRVSAKQRVTCTSVTCKHITWWSFFFPPRWLVWIWGAEITTVLFTVGRSIRTLWHQSPPRLSRYRHIGVGLDG